MHGGMCNKCAPAPPPSPAHGGGCGCRPAPLLMPQMMAAPAPMPEPMSDSEKKTMQDAAKQLFATLQDLDFAKVDMFDLKIAIAGDSDEMEKIAEAVESSEVADSSENVADISSDKDLEKKDDEED